MEKESPIYSCRECGQIVTLVHKGGGRLVCCNQLMQEGAKADKKPEAVPPHAPYWSCSQCHYVLQALTPPERCPACRQHCQFVDVSCYIPECSFTGIDARLMDKTKEVK